MFDNNWQMWTDLQNSRCIYDKDFHLICNVFLHYIPSESVKSKNVTDFDSVHNKVLT